MTVLTLNLILRAYRKHISNCVVLSNCFWICVVYCLQILLSKDVFWANMFVIPITLHAMYKRLFLCEEKDHRIVLFFFQIYLIEWLDRRLLLLINLIYFRYYSKTVWCCTKALCTILYDTFFDSSATAKEFSKLLDDSDFETRCSVPLSSRPWLVLHSIFLGHSVSPHTVLRC